MDEAVTSDTTFTSPNKLNLVIETAVLSFTSINFDDYNSLVNTNLLDKNKICSAHCIIKIKKVSTYFIFIINNLIKVTNQNQS